MARKVPESTVWQLRWDVATTKALEWLIHPAVLKVTHPEVHLFLADRYGLLARYHRHHGNRRRAQELDLKAAQHFRLGGGDEPPRAVAVAMGRPRPWKFVDAVSHVHLKPPDGVA